MERITLLVEGSGQRLSALLNPESLVLRRSAGVRARDSIGGAIIGTPLGDSPLVFTGGGTTELLVDLLFDVTLSGSSVQTDDVRDLTQRFFALAENQANAGGDARPPLVRFIWGKGWNFPGVVAAVAERLEFFTDLGTARRSWLRMRLMRVREEPPATPVEPPIAEQLLADVGPTDFDVPDGDVEVHSVVGAGADPSGVPGEMPDTERLDQIAQRYYGHPAMWRLLALYNDIADPLRLDPGTVLRVPPLNALAKESP